MKIFLSSAIAGYEVFRDAAARQAIALDNQVKRAEDFAASPLSPQTTCLQGVRWCEGLLLILGGRYGEPQESGLSPTHEEYREARNEKVVFAFVQSGIDPEPRQRAFIEEVQKWSLGEYTGGFATASDLEQEVTRALHRYDLAMVGGVVQASDLIALADELEGAQHGHGRQSPTLSLTVVGGPVHELLRPAKLGDSDLIRDVHYQALLGDWAVLNPEDGVDTSVGDNRLTLAQTGASVVVDQTGAIRIVQPASERGERLRVSLPALIEESVTSKLGASLRLASWILDRIDPTMKLTEWYARATLDNAANMAWRTSAEHLANPSSMTLSSQSGPVFAEASPSIQKRGALRYQVDDVVQDMIVRLRDKCRR